MITFTSLASGSTGNCYILKKNDGRILILELGIRWPHIQLALDFKASLVDMACVTHLHSDHSASVKNALKAGIECGMNQETADALGVADHHRVNILKAEELRQLAGWTILPFDLAHDVPTLGFFVSDGDDKLLFIPDTGFVHNRFTGITQIAIEANHVESILSQNIISGAVPAVIGHRIRRHHMSLEQVIAMLKSNDLSRCRAIYLLHLSDANSDERRMKLEVQQATGIPTIIC
jgi:phosphoribosyl 1,2-cyclic phosphodiesterase